MFAVIRNSEENILADIGRIKEQHARKLHEAELRYRAIFDQSPYGILIIDTDGSFIEFNESAHRDLGYSREEFSSLRISDIDPFESPAEIQASIREVLEKGEAEFEVRHRTKNGEIREVHVITQVLDLSGRKVFQTFWHDITDRKRADRELNAYRRHLEELVEKRTSELANVNERLSQDIQKSKLLEDRLRQSEERFRRIAETSIDVIFQTDLQGIITYCSPSVVQFGYAPEEIMGKHFNDYFSSSESSWASESFPWAAFGQGSNQLGMGILGKDGAPRYCEINITLVIEHERVTGIQGIARDITERKSAEREREELIKKLQGALSSIKTLRGLIPICAWCKKIRDDSGYWKKVETYIEEHSDASFTAGICPECLKKNDYSTYKEVFGKKKNGRKL